MATLIVFAPFHKSIAQTISSGDIGLGLVVTQGTVQRDMGGGYPQTVNVLNLYKINSQGVATMLHEDIFPNNSLNTFSSSQSLVDTATGKIYLKEPDQGGGLRYRVYNAATNTFEGYTTFTNVPSNSSPQFLTAPIQLNKIVRREGDALHIGENSLITVEENGVQKLYAQDANGNAIPINVTNGTDLQINGVSINGTIQTLDGKVTTNTANINNLGSGVAGATALSTALSSLPTLSDDTPYSCGVGTGAYSSRYAMGFGCAARVTERLAFNAGGSVVFGGSSDYGGGSLDNVAGRLGFVFKIGKITPTSNQAISKRAEKLEEQLNDVKQENQKLTGYLAEMKNLIAMQNERLGNLEKVANIPGSQLTSQSPKPSPNLEVASSSR